MQASVGLWTGQEVRALREARRLSVREFAAHLGVSDRMVSKWEAGGISIRPRPLNQAALDTSLSMASDEMKQRFVNILSDRQPLSQRPHHADLPSTPSQLTATSTAVVVRHPLDGKRMTLVEAGPMQPAGAIRPIWLPSFYIDIAPTTNADYERFLAATHPSGIPEHETPDATAKAVSRVSSANDPVLDLTWEDVSAYARWAEKHIPTSVQWEFAARHGITPANPWEWCQTDGQPTRRGTQSDHGGFRTAMPAADLHALLAI